MKLCKTTVIKTSDGQTFDLNERGKAIEHEFKLELTGLVQSPENRVNSISFRQENYTPRQVAEILVANAAKFSKTLAKYRQIRNREATKGNSLVRV